MKNNLLLCYLLIFATTINAQQNLQWAKRMGGTDGDLGLSITIDAAGNIYTTGSFAGTADFDPEPATFNLTSAGRYDIFISKLNAAGNFLWAKRMGGTDYDYGKSIAVDAAGNIYTTGKFIGTVDFDPGPATFNLTSAGSNDIFISKLNAAGNFLWAKRMGGTDHDYGESIAVDAAGNIYTTGNFRGTVDFDPGSATFNLTSAGSSDIFISKLNTAGNFVWTKQMGGTRYDGGSSITVDAAGNIYTTGYFQETVDFDPGSATFNLTAPGMLEDIFISKLNAAGNFVWAKRMGGTGYEGGSSIAVDAAGNIYTTGYFHETVDFDPGPATFNLTAAGFLEEIFISKLNAAGNFLWAKRMGGTDIDRGNSISVDAAGNIYTTGFFYETADFDPGSATFNLTSAGDDDIFISKLNAAGNFVWAKRLGETGSDKGRSIAVDAAGNIYTIGDFSGTADFDPGPATFNLTSAGSYDIFITKLCTSTTAIDNKTACNSYTWINGVTYTAPNNTATHILQNAAGCDSIVTLNLTINTVVATATINSNTLSAVEAGATYQWLDCNNANSPIDGATNQNFTPNTNGNYAVKVTKNGCTKTSVCYPITSIIEIVGIYPNPTNGSFTVGMGQIIDKGSISIKNVLGQEVYSESFSSKNKLEININLSAGTYFVTVFNDDKKFITLKLIKQ
ncbi:MAG: SBBP repeat-containing protein [Ferruginibacter sp.]|nr:SBBP repeat-containing protein [Ferruginibacter sp.]